MNISKIVFLYLLILPLQTISSQEINNYNNSNPSVTDIDFVNIELPPLELLYQNAQQNPTIEILNNQKKIQQRLLKKEKRSWLNFFSARAGYVYGKTDNYGTMSDVSTPPVFYQYTGMDQHYYNVGGNISIPLESLFDINGKIKRQKLAVENAELEKQKNFLVLKKEISTLYVQILSYISSLKVTAEAVSVAQAIYTVREKEFQAGAGEAENLLFAKRQQMELTQSYESIRSTLASAIFELEIISNTSIVSTQE